ncbi:response regulator [Reinekea marinisedimentorum]|uniref:Response regulator receiver domain-containing protein n=1 Tax=Reinekea marinisedimentorum TaxID=230495 RepID=A0A4R3HT92_9GAMM|nr:response regulator [Reinekea marinisedimentorum]TCS35914.1 response regulator receiver domain-containing protein [Reinekea marinisedimentorum]
MQKLSFLVVDDAAFIRDLIKRTIKSQFSQCQLDEAVNGRKAQSLLAKKKYDLVLCDWEMPEMSGMELLQWFRAYEAENSAGKTPFMMVTSRGEKSHVIAAVESGVSEYIGKPFSHDQLLKKVFKLLSVNHRELIRAILKGTATMQPKSSGTGNDSASVLTAKPVDAKPAKTPEAKSSAGLLAAGSRSESLVDKAPMKQAKAARRNLGLVDIRTPSSSWKAMLRDISLTDAVVLVDFAEGKPPAVLEQVVIDLQPKGKALARINAFVTAVSLHSKALDCHQAEVAIHVVDDDNDKLETLSYFVAEAHRR